ncbi:hypothetical protein ACSXCN_04705 [Clostridium perfringens]
MDLRKSLKNKKIGVKIAIVIAIVIVFSAIMLFTFWGCHISMPAEVMASIITGVFTSITFLGTLAILFNNSKNNKEKSLLDVVTKNRADWIKEMKGLFSEYFIEYDKNKDKRSNLIKIKNKISLRLNPNELIAQEILSKLSKLTELDKKSNFDLRDETETQIRLYLKCEWERVKFETKEGLKKYDFNYEFRKIELINYLNSEKVDFKIINALKDNSLPKDLSLEKKQIEVEKFKKDTIGKIESFKLSRDKVIMMNRRIKLELSKNKN